MNVFILLHFPQKFLLANSVDPDQTPRSAAFELGLHCLHNIPKGIAGLKNIEDI